MVLLRTKVKRAPPKKSSAPSKEIFKRKLAKKDHMTKDRSGRKNQDIKIRRTNRLLPASRKKKKKRSSAN